MSNYFYQHFSSAGVVQATLERIRTFANEKGQQIYILNSPLAETSYDYPYKDAFVFLSSGMKVCFVDFGNNPEEFKFYVEDVIEDIAALSHKFTYKDVIGRPRVWKETLIEECVIDQLEDLPSFIESIEVVDPKEKRRNDLLISLFTGSINDVSGIGLDEPVTLLDKVKQKIILFDDNQTDFIYSTPQSKRITIQGLSGTGKTELLLHKLKDIYVNEEDSKVFFTCWNKVLADKLRKRIPVFFNLMRVEKQIKWDERMWCATAWGSKRRENSGAYTYICNKYDVPFSSLTEQPFSKACDNAAQLIKEIKSKSEKFEYAFDYMLIDESQDFSKEFFELCELVTSKFVYIAGDIFQSIFDAPPENIVNPTYLLSKCYRTDPKTLMFAHGLGMGLFEKNKLHWLEDKDWESCGYHVERDESNLILSRDPIKRFEDIPSDYESVKIVSNDNLFTTNIVDTIKKLKRENPTLSVNDIGIILLDRSNFTYTLATKLEYVIAEEFNWEINLAWVSKQSIPDTLFISNRNNVKGLEFPFVLCVTQSISISRSYRNALYTMLSRSFLQSYFIVPSDKHAGYSETISDGWKTVLRSSKMIIEEPDATEQLRIKTRFKELEVIKSHRDEMFELFDIMNVEEAARETIYRFSKDADIFSAGVDMKEEFINDQLKYLRRSES